MTTLTNTSGRWPRTSSMTPPVLCSSRASESSGSGRRVTLTPADSMEYIRKMIKEDRSSSLLDKSGYNLDSINDVNFICDYGCEICFFFLNSNFDC